VVVAEAAADMAGAEAAAEAVVARGVRIVDVVAIKFKLSTLPMADAQKGVSALGHVLVEREPGTTA
jgi:hypothetical protein